MRTVMQDRKWSVIAIGAIVSLLTGALLYVSLKPKQKTKGKTTAAAAVQQVQETTTAEVEVEGEGEQETRDAVQVIDEQELARRVNQALQHVLSNPQAVATDAVQELVDLVKDIDPAAYTPSTRLLTVRWFMHCLMVSTVIAANNGVDPNEVMESCKEDLDIAWQWVSFDANLVENDSDIEKYILMTLDISERRADYVNLASAFERAITLESSQELMLAAFHVAPILGKWKDFVELGNKIREQNPTIMDQLHNLSAQSLQMPDYEVLFQTASEAYEKSEPLDVPVAPTSLLFKSQGCRMRLQDAFGDNEDQINQIKASIATQNDWQEVDLNPDSCIMKKGSLLQAHGISTMPISLVGMYRDSNFVLKGYTVQEHEQVGLIKLTEELNLKRSTEYPNLWTGHSILTQNLQVGPSIESTTMQFEMELELLESAL